MTGFSRASHGGFRKGVSLARCDPKRSPKQFHRPKGLKIHVNPKHIFHQSQLGVVGTILEIPPDRLGKQQISRA
jgi:hypothetical protein